MKGGEEMRFSRGKVGMQGRERQWRGNRRQETTNLPDGEMEKGRKGDVTCIGTHFRNASV